MASYKRESSASKVVFHMEDEELVYPVAQPQPQQRAAAAKPAPVAATAVAPAPAAAAAAPTGVTKTAQAHREFTKREKCLAVGQTCGFLLFVLYPLIVAILMGLYYLYAKYTDAEVHAFAIIWLVFVVVLMGGMLLGWRRREAEAKIARAQFEADEREKELAIERKNHKLEVAAADEAKHN